MNQNNAQGNEYQNQNDHISYDPQNSDHTSDAPHTDTTTHTNTTADTGESDYTFVPDGSPDGREYTTPGGSHGYIYSPEYTPKCSGVGRRVLIAICVVGAVILLMGCCLLGAFVAAYANGYAFGVESEETEYVFEIPGTTDGLVIVDGTERGEHILENNPENDTVGEASGDVNGDVMGNTQDTTAINTIYNDSLFSDVHATIDKKDSQSVDENKDGKADVVFDEAGNVVTSAGDNILNTATIVAKVAASVVEISTETLVQSDRVGQYITGGAGSGVIIAKEGYIVTNNHVIADADNITVTLNNGKQFAAALVGTDEATDIAVIWIDPKDYELTVAPLGCSYDLVAGEDVIAIGNPLGSLGGTVTEGIISATERLINMDGNVMKLLQVSAPINPGNSGGGLFNMAGELVGVVNAKVSSEEIEGLGFAIPVDVAYDIACELIEHRYVRGRVTTGLTLVDVTSSTTAMYYFGTRYTGVYITESTVCTNLQYGDRILTVNGQEIAQTTDVKTAISGRGVGDTVEIVVYRKNQQVTVTLTLAEYVPDYVTQSMQPAA